MPIYIYDDGIVFGLGKYTIIYFNNMKWESNIEMNLKEMCEDISWTTVLQERNLLTHEQTLGSIMWVS
jgi:hypothetical protein